MIVTLGNFRAREAQMLICTSRSALVCKSLAPVCQRMDRDLCISKQQQQKPVQRPTCHSEYLPCNEKEI